MFLIVQLSGLIGLTLHSMNLMFVFISAQLSLSYLTSGIVKVASRDWRNGRHLLSILSTRTFGHHFVAERVRLLKVPTGVLSFIVICVELAGAATPWIPLRPCLIALTVMLMFHIANAFVMGLNTFVPAFCSAFPAAIMTSQLLHHKG
jgi:hypothetical protein